MNQVDVTEGLKKEQINFYLLNLNIKNLNGLIAIFNTIGYYSYLST